MRKMRRKKIQEFLRERFAGEIKKWQTVTTKSDYIYTTKSDFKDLYFVDVYASKFVNKRVNRCCTVRKWACSQLWE